MWQLACMFATFVFKSALVKTHAAPPRCCVIICFGLALLKPSHSFKSLGFHPHTTSIRHQHHSSCGNDMVVEIESGFSLLKHASHKLEHCFSQPHRWLCAMLPHCRRAKQVFVESCKTLLHTATPFVSELYHCFLWGWSCFTYYLPFWTTCLMHGSFVRFDGPVLACSWTICHA